MRPLATEFHDSHFTYTQLQRTDTMALYEQRHKASMDVYYEVIVIQRYGETHYPNGQTVPPRESYPPPSSWGRWGWTFRQRAEAEAFLRQRETTQPAILPTP